MVGKRKAEWFMSAVAQLRYIFQPVEGDVLWAEHWRAKDTGSSPVGGQYFVNYPPASAGGLNQAKTYNCQVKKKSPAAVRRQGFRETPIHFIGG